MNISYSFIIPHKNSVRLLERCLNSIPIRDDIQIIVVDDNSEENESLQTLITKFPQAELYLTKENRGAGYARNVGLKYAKGKWLLFADADDFYHKENLSTVINKYLSDDKTDLIYLNAKKIDDDGNVHPYVITSYINNYLNKRIYSEKVLRYGIWTPWTRMVRRKLVEDNNLLFEEVSVGNDIMFCLNCSKYAQTIGVETSITYFYYTPTNGSITAKNYILSMLESRCNSVILRNKIYDSVGYMLKGNILKILFSQFKNDKYSRETLLQIKRIIIKYKYNLFADLFYLIINGIARILHIK